MPRYTGDNNNNIFTAPNDGSSWVISGKGGDDILTGGNNDDIINGDEGNDTIYGGGGNDNINGGEGYDYIFGGDGDDILVDTQGSVDGGAGIDFLKADYSQFDNGAGIHVGWLGYNIIFSRVDGSGLLAYNNVERFEITGTKYVDILQGGAYNDNLNGGDGDDQISGGAGNDNLNGGAGFDYLFGGDGNDILIDIDGNVDGGAGTDTLKADYSLFNNGVGIEVGYNGESAIYSAYNQTPESISSGNDYLWTAYPLLRYSNIEKFEITGTQYTDVLRGGANNDTLNGGGGYNYLFGGAGNDILINFQGAVDGGAGTDTLIADYSQFNNGVGIEVQYYGQNAIYSNDNSIPPGSPFAYNAFPLLTYNNVEKFDITGTQYADKLRGGADNDILRGGGGDDQISGGAGNDTLNGGDGNDVLIDTDGIVDGGAGTDTLKADYSQFNNGAGIYFGIFGKEGIRSLSTGNPVLMDYTNIEQFQVTGTQYGDLLVGSDRNDILNGGGGNDGIGGGAGYDYLFGGDGDDLLVDIDGSVDGGAGTDTLRADYSQYNNGAGVHVGYLGQDVIFSRLTGMGILGYSNIEKFEITGTQYADVLQGGANNDILNGEAGDDQITGGFGNDTLTGGFGADKFVFNSIFDSSDVIKDFNSAEGDKIQISQQGFGIMAVMGSSGIVDHNSFSYNNATGGLFYQGTQFATLENKPTDFVVNQDILIV